MQTSVWTRESNPAIDPPDYNVPREIIAFQVSLGAARWIPNSKGKITHHRAQLISEHRLDHQPAAKPSGYINAAGIEGFTHWRVVGQTARGGGEHGPSAPSWQMVF